MMAVRPLAEREERLVPQRERRDDRVDKRRLGQRGQRLIAPRAELFPRGARELDALGDAGRSWLVLHWEGGGGGEFE